MSAAIDRSALEKLEAGTHVLMPVKANAEMMQAIEDYFLSRFSNKGKPRDLVLAQCWMALMAYGAMVDLFKDETQAPDNAQYCKHGFDKRLSCSSCLQERT